MRQKPIILWLCGLHLVSACVDTGASGQSIDDPQLVVKADDNYYWPANPTITSDGRQVEVDVFPIVSALVVRRADGTPLGQGDKTAARRAVVAYCAAQSLGASDGNSRLADGAWAFFPCINPWTTPPAAPAP